MSDEALHAHDVLCAMWLLVDRADYWIESLINIVDCKDTVAAEVQPMLTLLVRSYNAILSIASR